MKNEVKIPVSVKMTHALFITAFVASSFHASSDGTAYLKSGYSSERVSFSIKYNDERTSYRTASLFTLPGERNAVVVTEASPTAVFQWSGSLVATSQPSAREWVFTAPQKPGLYPIRLTETGAGESVLLNVFVMVPYSKVRQGMLNGYRIGSYPTVPKNIGALYNRPKGFIEITKENRNTLLTPHFRLSQFLCKQQGGYPKYIVLRERLPLKLEAVLEKINERGVPANSLSIMSGYRTPYYNRAIGNVSLSRHMFGDAADIFVDSEPRENYMADLNADGKRDHRDGDVLYKILNEVEEHPSFAPYVGGLAKYKPTKYHGPFVHIDARGAAKRWNN